VSPAPTPASPLSRSAGLTGIATFSSRVLGLAREQLLAALFGAGSEMDAFIVAFRIPNLVRDLFAEGAMSAAFVPTFTRRLTLSGKASAWRLGNNLLNALLLCTGILVLAGIVFARPLVSAYAQDFARVPGKLELTIQLTRVMLPFLTMVAVAAAVMGMLNSLNHYFVPAMAPALFNVATIVCALTLVPLMPSLGYPRITAIAIAALVGGALQVLVQWPSLRSEGFRYRPLLEPRDEGLRQVLLLMGPGTIGLAATQVNLLVNTLLATQAGTGAVSWLTYAFRIMYLPLGLFGISIATAVLPTVSRHAAGGDDQGVRQTVVQGIAIMLMLNVPATLGLLTLAEPIVRLLFERGHFLQSDTAATAAALRWYAVGLVGYASARILSPVFYALHLSRVPVVASVGTMAVNVLVNVLLVRTMGYQGLALGTSLAMIANGGILVLWLHRRLKGLEGSYLAVVSLKIVGAALVMAGAASGVERVMVMIVPGHSVAAQALRLFATILSGVGVLAVASKLLRIREFDEAWFAVSSVVTRRTRRLPDA
jgi:putative peptidoglycan lipid II flippase